MISYTSKPITWHYMPDDTLDCFSCYQNPATIELTGHLTKDGIPVASATVCVCDGCLEAGKRRLGRLLRLNRKVSTRVANPGSRKKSLSENR